MLNEHIHARAFYLGNGNGNRKTGVFSLVSAVDANTRALFFT